MQNVYYGKILYILLINGQYKCKAHLYCEMIQNILKNSP